jgi:hypothetical protein
MEVSRKGISMGKKKEANTSSKRMENCTES